jgi:hypothetical protein
MELFHLDTNAVKTPVLKHFSNLLFYFGNSFKN